MDNVGIVVDDLKAVTAFFVELGLELEGEATVEGRWVDRIVGLDGVRNDIAMMRTPDDHSRLELIKFHRPTAPNSSASWSSTRTSTGSATSDPRGHHHRAGRAAQLKHSRQVTTRRRQPGSNVLRATLARRRPTLSNKGLDLPLR
jgi:hypothetical protein